MIQVGFKTSTGLLRDNNEDAFFIIPGEDVYVVADGVGGYKAGELASHTAVKMVAEYIRDHDIRKCAESGDIQAYFQKCLHLANREIYRLADKYADSSGMATTAVIAYIRGNKGYFANVGDSRAYLYRYDEIYQITEDHTYVNTLVKQGKISKEDAKLHEQRNVITRALGAEADIVADFFQEDLLKGDSILICTDGLYEEVSELDIKDILGSGGSMPEVCSNLVGKAIECGGSDNITVICLKI